uniref:Uncharacterized protein n=1 Tax=Romanomermis culicivorax TaxID=13658 RepID=A0A915J4H7_ROMCU
MVGPRVALLAAIVSVAINSTGWRNRVNAAGELDDQSRNGIVGRAVDWAGIKAVGRNEVLVATVVAGVDIGAVGGSNVMGRGNDGVEKVACSTVDDVEQWQIEVKPAMRLGDVVGFVHVNLFNGGFHAVIFVKDDWDEGESITHVGAGIPVKGGLPFRDSVHPFIEARSRVAVGEILVRTVRVAKSSD